MDELLATLKGLVEKTSLVQVAHMLGHTDTQTLRRWINQGRIPKSSLIGVRSTLEVNKVIKTKRAQ